MRNQYIIIHSWMLGMGLSASELLALAVIHSYTSFRGCFDGDEDWLARWACVKTDKLAGVIGSLESRGLIYCGVGRWGNKTYKSGCIESCPRARNINNINIDHNNKNNNMGDIPMGNITIEDNNKRDNMGDIPMGNITGEGGGADEAHTEAPEPSKTKRASAETRKPLSGEELAELIAPYDNVADVPPSELIERLAKRAAARSPALTV